MIDKFLRPRGEFSPQNLKNSGRIRKLIHRSNVIKANPCALSKSEIVG